MLGKCRRSPPPLPQTLFLARARLAVDVVPIAVHRPQVPVDLEAGQRRGLRTTPDVVLQPRPAVGVVARVDAATGGRRREDRHHVLHRKVVEGVELGVGLHHVIVCWVQRAGGRPVGGAVGKSVCRVPIPAAALHQQRPAAAVHRRVHEAEDGLDARRPRQAQVVGAVRLGGRPELDLAAGDARRRRRRAVGRGRGVRLSRQRRPRRFVHILAAVERRHAGGELHEAPRRQRQQHCQHRRQQRRQQPSARRRRARALGALGAPH